MKKKLLLIIIVFVELGNLSFANHQADSLLQLIKTAKHDTSKVIYYEQLALVYKKLNKDSAYFFNQKAIDVALKTKLPKFIAEAYREYALTAQSNDNYELTVKYHQKSLVVHQKSNYKKGIANAYNDIGVAYYYAGDYEKARENFEKSGTIKIQIGDSIGAGQAFNNTGIMHDIAGNPTEALKLYIQALTIYESARDTNMIIGTISNIGLIYIGQKNYNEALKTYIRQKNLAKAVNNQINYGIALTSEGTALDYLYKYHEARERFYEALKIFEKLDDKPLIAQCYNNLSVNYELTKEYDKALDYALKSIQIKKEIGSHGKLAISQISAAIIYDRKGQYQKAISLFKEALTNAENTGYVEYVIKSHLGLSKAYKNVKDYEKAYHHQSLYISYNDSVTNTENAEMINEMEKKFQSERKEQEIALLNKTNALKDVELAKANEESKRKSMQLYGSLIVGAILLTLAVVVIRNNQQRKKANELLAQKNTEITKQKEMVEKAHHELEEKNKEITDSIQYAKRIQNAILPPAKVVKEYLQESFILYKPKDIVAGDFYWLEQKNGKVLFAAADCTGHGVPGAMVSVICNNGLNRSVREHELTDPGKILDKTREIVIQEFEKSEDDVKDGMDIALCSLEDSILHYAGANNPLWIIKNGNNEIVEINADKQPIGKYDSPKPYTTHRIELQKGDCFYIFSDGYADQFGGDKGKKFKSTNFKKLLLSIKDESLEKQKDLIDKAFAKWKGDNEQVDDVCVIGVKI